MKDKMEEIMFLGLRMMRGVSANEFLERFGRNMWKLYGSVIERFVSQGMLEVRAPWVRLTEKGIDVSNRILAEFLLDEEG